MAITMSKTRVKNLLNIFGLEIHRKGSISDRSHRATMRGCLEQAVSNGLNPATVFDIGAATGTPDLYEVFPDARHVLIEPLEEYLAALDSWVHKLRKAEYIIAVATSEPGNLVINVHPDLVGSSIYEEGEDSNVNGFQRTVSAVTLDQVCRNKDLEGPFLIKIDTQGSELDVLMGARTVLSAAAFVILEVSLFEFFDGGPQLFDCISFMENRGFVVYDIFDPQYRLLDGAMSQVDIAFVQGKSHFREFHFYATGEQRDQQNKHFAMFRNGKA